jgi:alpha-glucosidase
MRKLPLYLRKFALAIGCILLLAYIASAAPNSVGNITSIMPSKTNGVVISTSSGAKVLVEFFDQNVIRVRLAPNGNFERDFSYAVYYSHDRKTPAIKTAQTPTEITLTNFSGGKIVIQKRPFSIRIFDENGNLVVEDDPHHPTQFDPETGEIQTTKLRSSEVETYYGFGEKAFAEMSRDGKFIVNWNTDTFSYPIGTDPIYESIPFFYALHDGRAYGIFFNNTYRTWFDMGKTSPDRYSFGADGGELDYFVFTGGKQHSPKNVLTDYAELTGKTPLPPIWALGNQQSRWSYFPDSRVREIANGFRKNRIPADVIYLDIDYMNGYRVFTWDKSRFPDPPKLVSDLKAQGFQTVLIVDPGIKVDGNYSVYKSGQQAGIFVKNPDGTELHRDVWPQAAAFPDFTDPKARAWWGEQFKKNIDEGIAGFWNDMNEPGVFLNDKSENPEILHHPAKTFPLDTPHAGDGIAGTHRRYHNIFGMQMARATFEGEKNLRPNKRPFVLTRAGFSGVQRFSAVWTGDNYASWDQMAMTIPMLLNMSVSGIPFVGADVGGFNDRPTPELYSRWLEAAALTPFLRSHSVGWAGNKEPWEYGDEYTAINRSTVELRYRLLPYIYTLFHEHEQTGMPVIRPLWFEYPTDKKTYLVADEYLLGRDLLAAPVVKEGMREREVYFPVGDEWIDWWTGERFAGGKAVTVKAPLDHLPLFARVGAVIPSQPIIQNTGEMSAVPITLTIAGGIANDANGVSTLYQDAGDGYGYKSSEWREFRFETQQGLLKISKIGNFAGQPISSIEIIGLASGPRELRVDGRIVAFMFDEANKQLKAIIPENAVEISLVR